MRRIPCPIAPEELRHLYCDEKLTDDRIVQVVGQGATLKRVRSWRQHFNITSINSTERHELPPIEGRLRSLLVGSMLGDGRLIRPSHVARYAECHSDAQRSYLQWKAEHWGSWIRAGVKSTAWTLNGKTFPGWRFTTLGHASLNEWHALFYPSDGRKRLTPALAQYVDTFALAIWYLDDGGAAWWPTITFGLDPESRLIAIDILKQFSLSPRWTPRKGNTGDLIFNGEDQAHLFISLVRPHVPECMAYKLDFGFQGKHYHVRQSAPEPRLRELAATGLPIARIADQLGVGESTVHRYLQKFNIEHLRPIGRPRSL